MVHYDASLMHHYPYMMVRCAGRQHTLPIFLRIFQKSNRSPIFERSNRTDNITHQPPIVTRSFSPGFKILASISF